MICGARRESITAERVFRIRTRLPSSSPTIRGRSMIVPQRAGAAHGTRRCARRCEERGGNTRPAGGRRPRPRSTAQSPLRTMRTGTGARVRTPAPPSSSPTTMRRSSANAPQRAGAAQRKVRGACRSESAFSVRMQPREPHRTARNLLSRGRPLDGARPAAPHRNVRGERRARPSMTYDLGDWMSVHPRSPPSPATVRRSSANEPQRAGATQRKAAICLTRPLAGAMARQAVQISC